MAGISSIKSAFNTSSAEVLEPSGDWSFPISFYIVYHTSRVIYGMTTALLVSVLTEVAKTITEL